MILRYYNIGKHKLFPINRSITGKGVIKTLKIIKDEIPEIKIKKIKSGTKVFDWKIPPEWNVKKAYVLDKKKDKIIDFKQNNLHLVSYSVPVNKFLRKDDFLKKLHYLKKQPKAIPYITSYYKKNYGFCISYQKFLKLNKEYKSKDKFKILIESKFNYGGNLNYGELVLHGKSKKEILISTYICHPSMANNELSGPIVVMALINHFKKIKLEKTIRFVLIPETIGSIAYINKNLKKLKKNVIGGYVLTCIGDEKNHSCMLSKYKNSPSDEAILQAYEKLKIKKFKIHPFYRCGSDERQYNSPGIDLGITSIFRTKYENYKEYHTSLDNFKLVTIKGIKGGFRVAKKSIELLLKKNLPISKTFCEPQLGRRGLYPFLSKKKYTNFLRKLKSFLQYSDGKNSLERISNLIKTDLITVKKIYKVLISKKLID
jgi:aminopeptidase-like protein